jgi:hypothetical protein
MISALRELLVPQTTIITPNSVEARRLVQEDGEDDIDLAECARRLLATGCEYVLITGTHENTPQVVNTLYGQEGVVRSDSWERFPAVSRLGLHARLRDRGDDRQRTEHQRRRQGRAGIHLADAESRISSRAWASIFPIACSGRARKSPSTKIVISGLYAVTPDLADTRSLLTQTTAALAGGVELLQYRNKTARRTCGADRLRRWRNCAGVTAQTDHQRPCRTCERSRRRRRACRRRRRCRIVSARASRPGKIVGASCYDDLQRAQAAAAAGADYLAFGSFFASAVKPGAVRAPLSILPAARRRFGLPWWRSAALRSTTSTV